MSEATEPGASPPPAAHGGPQGRPASPDLARQALDDALYYLRDGCVPCAERQFHKARKFGATTEMVDAVRRVAAAGTGQP